MKNLRKTYIAPEATAIATVSCEPLAGSDPYQGGERDAKPGNIDMKTVRSTLSILTRQKTNKRNNPIHTSEKRPCILQRCTAFFVGGIIGTTDIFRGLRIKKNRSLLQAV